MKKYFTRVFFVMLLLVMLAPVGTVSAASVKKVAKKMKQPGYTATLYYNKKNNKFLYGTLDLVIRKKVNGNVIASQLKSKKSSAKMQLFYLGDRETVAYRKSGKPVRLYSLKTGTKVRVTFNESFFEETGRLVKGSGGKTYSCAPVGTGARITLR